MFVALAAALMLSGGQTPLASQDPVSPSDPVALEDVVVTGQSLDNLIRNFVGEVAEPNRGRGLARWDDAICVGVANLKGEAAQYIADRVSTVATDIGLNAGGPNCTPNILVVATDDGEGLARELVGERARAFRMGGTGMDRGRVALEEFQQGEKPVRWWQMAIPVDSETGNRAVRIPGECANACDRVSDYAPTISVFAASRLRSQIVDRLSRTIVILDVDQIGEVSILQLADYIAMVSLAQIDPDADTQAYASILNVFDDPLGSESLTSWDQAYLEGLYGVEGFSKNRRSGRTDVASSIQRAHERLRDASGPSQD